MDDVLTWLKERKEAGGGPWERWKSRVSSAGEWIAGTTTPVSDVAGAAAAAFEPQAQQCAFVLPLDEPMMLMPSLEAFKRLIEGKHGVWVPGGVPGEASFMWPMYAAGTTQMLAGGMLSGPDAITVSVYGTADCAPIEQAMSGVMPRKMITDPGWEGQAPPADGKPAPVPPAPASKKRALSRNQMIAIGAAALLLGGGALWIWRRRKT
jgi:LPXTG-motif cell wall-anchored protein